MNTEATPTRPILTPEAIGEARTKGIAATKAVRAKNEERLNKRIDDLITFLQANRGHIAGIGAVVVPIDATTLVDTDTGETSDGLVMRSALHSGYANIIAAQAKDLFDTNPRNPFAALRDLIEG